MEQKNISEHKGNEDYYCFDPHCTNDLGQTPLHYFAYKGDVMMARILLLLGANADKADVKGATPLHFAALGGHGVVIHELLKAGADLKK